jgi:hypothetical protein
MTEITKSITRTAKHVAKPAAKPSQKYDPAERIGSPFPFRDDGRRITSIAERSEERAGFGFDLPKLLGCEVVSVASDRGRVRFR